MVSTEIILRSCFKAVHYIDKDAVPWMSSMIHSEKLLDEIPIGFIMLTESAVERALQGSLKQLVQSYGRMTKELNQPPKRGDIPRRKAFIDDVRVSLAWREFLNTKCRGPLQAGGAVLSFMPLSPHLCVEGSGPSIHTGSTRHLDRACGTDS